METLREEEQEFLMFQSLFYWILFFYLKLLKKYTEVTWRFNPYFTGFSSFIHARRHGQDDLQSCFNPYSIGFSSFIWAEYLRKNECTGVSILILLDSILLYRKEVKKEILENGFNPYSIGFYSLIKFF